MLLTWEGHVFDKGTSNLAGFLGMSEWILLYFAFWKICNHGNIVTEGSPKSGLCPTLIEWLQGFFIAHSTIDNMHTPGLWTVGSTAYAQHRWQIFDTAGIRTQYLWVLSHNRIEWLNEPSGPANRIAWTNYSILQWNNIAYWRILPTRTTSRLLWRNHAEKTPMKGTKKACFESPFVWSTTFFLQWR